MLFRFLLFVVVSSFFYVESSSAFLLDDQENQENGPQITTPPTPPRKTLPAAGPQRPPISPSSRLDAALSPVRNSFACDLVLRGSVSPSTMQRTYLSLAPELVEPVLWADPALLDSTTSVQRMQEGLNPRTHKGEPMEVHHLFQDDSSLALLPRSLHRSLGRRIVVERDPVTGILRPAGTRLSRGEAIALKVQLEKANPGMEFHIVSNALHPRRGRSLIDRGRFNTKRRRVLRDLSNSSPLRADFKARRR